MCLKKHFQEERKAAQSANQASLAMMMSSAAAASAADSNDIFNDGPTEENITLSVADMTLEEAGGGDVVTSDPLPMMNVRVTPTDK